MKPSGHRQVEEFMNRLEHPLKKDIETVQQIVLGADNRLTERIKWNAPSFCANGEDRVTMNLRGRDSFLLIFHRGAKVPSDEEQEFRFQDATGLLTFLAPDRATIKFAETKDIKAGKEALAQVVRDWIEATA
jgi:hypothetical protein